MTKKDYELIAGAIANYANILWDQHRIATNNGNHKDAEKYDHLRDGVIQFAGSISVDLEKDNPNFNNEIWKKWIFSRLDRSYD